MKLIFDSTDEVAAFYDEYLSDDDSAPASEGAPATTTRRRRGPNRPKGDAAAAGGNPNVQPQTPAFAPPPTGQPVAPPQTGFPGVAGAAPTQGFPNAAPPAPAVHPLVPQIIAAVEKTFAAGAPVDPAVGWFRSMIPEAAQANWEQIKASFLPKAPEATLMNIAQQTGVLQPAQ